MVEGVSKAVGTSILVGVYVNNKEKKLQNLYLNHKYSGGVHFTKVKPYHIYLVSI